MFGDLQSMSGISKLQRPNVTHYLFRKYSFTETQSCSFLNVLSMVVLTLHYQDEVVAIKFTETAKLKMFTLSVFSGKVCRPLVYVTITR